MSMKVSADGCGERMAEWLRHITTESSHEVISPRAGGDDPDLPLMGLDTPLLPGLSTEIMDAARLVGLPPRG